MMSYQGSRGSQPVSHRSPRIRISWAASTGTLILSEGHHQLAEDYLDNYRIYEAQQNKKWNTNKLCIKDPNEEILMLEDITENMLDKVCGRFSKKV